jgi:succinate-semialdehyde dehydrogenase / glutarate-semialdehyde dehydrogenase
VHSLVQDGVAKGAELIAGGRRLDSVGENFYEPTLMSGITSSMDLSREEIFGPVAAIVK